MSTSRSRLVSTRRGLRLAGLTLVLAGLFGMHGLDGHDAVAGGSVHRSVMAGMATSPGAVDGGSAAGLGHRFVLLGAQNVSEPTAVGASGPGGMDMGMATMCVAILAAAMMALVRFLLGARAPRLLWKLGRQIRAVSQHAGRDSDPPSLIALSIQRC